MENVAFWICSMSTQMVNPKCSTSYMLDYISLINGMAQMKLKICHIEFMHQQKFQIDGLYKDWIINHDNCRISIMKNKSVCMNSWTLLMLPLWFWCISGLLEWSVPWFFSVAKWWKCCMKWSSCRLIKLND